MINLLLSGYSPSAVPILSPINELSLGSKEHLENLSNICGLESKSLNSLTTISKVLSSKLILCIDILISLFASLPSDIEINLNKSDQNQWEIEVWI